MQGRLFYPRTRLRFHPVGLALWQATQRSALFQFSLSRGPRVFIHMITVKLGFRSPYLKTCWQCLHSAVRHAPHGTNIGVASRQEASSDSCQITYFLVVRAAVVLFQLGNCAWLYSSRSFVSTYFIFSKPVKTRRKKVYCA